jgi:MoaA/NifB/PqqE/SkfB family radical SAM enzyme
MLALWHWHIEISSKCTLRCPRCARQEVPNGLKNTELDLAFFHKNFPPAFIEQHVRKVTFCGDDGDPIYAHDLIPVIKYFKSCADVEIVIVTNGSHRSENWWRSLGHVLDHHDTVHFSIDGYDNASNNLYRVNSDWDSIMEGIVALRGASDARLVWATIVFDFNQDHLNNIERHARSRGFDFLQITRSTKFAKVYPIYGPTDSLQPRSEWIAPGHRFDREVIPLDRKIWPKAHSDNLKSWDTAQAVYKDNPILPLCAIGNKGLFINSQGHFFPCCWVANRYEHNTEWIERGRQFDLTQITLFDVLKHSFWDTEFQTFRWQECQNKCSQGVVNDKYATEW